MLEDRVYMRRPSLSAGQSAVTWLLITNVVAFIFECAFYGYPPRFAPGDYLALSLAGLRHGYLWQLFSFQFMHAGFLHLLFNGLALFMFGRNVEELLGRRSFLALYLASGAVGGLFQALAGLLFGGIFAAPTVGASAGVFGVIAAFARLYPERPVTVLLVVIPVTLPAKIFLLASAVLAIIFIVFPVNQVANAAHLGGLLAGLLFIRYLGHWQWRWPPRRARADRSQLVNVPHHQSASWNGNATASSPENLSSEEFLSKQVDPILEKISRNGIQSLTERERKILESARLRMSKR